MLRWVRRDGQPWRAGSDIATFDRRHPGRSPCANVLWNDTDNRPLGRFQSPGRSNDADLTIGGDPGLSLAETRSPLALRSIPGAPIRASGGAMRCVAI